MTLKTRKSAIPHIEWIDLTDNGVYVECAVMKKDGRGNMYIIPLNKLDGVDLLRMHDIVSNRNAKSYALWDLMSQITLGNGINALFYFHQLVDMVTSNGQILKPRLGVVGNVVTVQEPQVAPPVA